MTWCLVGNSGVVHILPKSMIFVGRENCEINIPSRSVDRRHSVITFDRFENSFSIKDMETLNGTFVNDTRIPDQTYVDLHRGDSIRFGYDPITYRFDEVDGSCIRQFTAGNGVTQMEMEGMEAIKEAPDVDEECRNEQEHNMEEGIIEPDTTNSGAYLTRPHTRHDEDHTSHQYEHRADAALENSMSTHSKTSLPKQDSVTSPPSALYGQPAWWGQDDHLEGEEFIEEKERDSRHRSDTYKSNGKDKNSSSSTGNLKQLERPTKLPLDEAERDRDIPIHMYTRRPTDLNPTTPSKRAPATPEHTEVTLVSASEKHVGFTIEFNAKEDAPKMSMNESLSEFVPATVKSKIEESTKIVEGRKAERKMKKGFGDDPDSYQSPRASPSAVQKLNNLWASTPVKKGPKVGQGDSRSANNSEAGKVDSSKQLKMRPIVSPRQPTTSKSGPIMSRSSRSSHHRNEEDENQNGDNVSESGTYTIESETQSKEVLEARSKIDEVFGVEASMDTKQGSDEDTDKDIGDGEIEEEAVTADTVHTQQMDINRYLDQEYGKPNEQEIGKSSSFQPKPPATGSSNTPAWVRQWAVLANKDNTKPPHEHGKYTQGNNSQSPRDHSIGEEYKNHTQDHAQSAAPKPPPRRSGKRLLPTTPPERGDRHSPHSTSLDDSPRTNGIRQSPSSAFYSTRNRVGVEQEETTTKEINSPPWGTQSSEVNPTVSVSREDMELRQSHEDDGLDLNTEVSMDTDLLLKDTETFVKNLEMRMRGRKESTPSPELSESYDYSHRSFDGDVDTDLDSTSCVGVVGTHGNTYPQRGNQASLPPSGYQGKRSIEDRNSQSKSNDTKTSDAKNKKGSIWNRLSQPVRYKRNEKTLSSSKNKDSSAASDGMSDSMDSASFRRNTNLSASLPTGRVTGRKTPRESDSRDTSPKIIRKIKANLSKPRQTRSTMLRKSRFDGKDSPGPEQTDISPSSSLSDMSSSRNSSMLRRSSLQKDGGRCQSPKDMHVRTKTTGARIDTGRQRLSSRSSDQTPRSEVSLGGQIVQHARSQSLRESKMNAGEMSSRIMSKTQNSSTTSSTRTSTSTASRKTSQSSSDVSAVKKAPSGTWRRYKEPPTDESDNINAYIRSVTGRHSSLSSADESSIKSAPIYNYYKPRSNSSTNAPQQKTVSLQQLRGGGVSRSQQELRNGDDIAQASSSLAQSLQRLAKGEGAFGMAMENIPKDERMMDEIFSEDTVGVNSNERQAENHKQPLQRSTSVSNNIAEGIFAQTPVLAKPGSPPVSLKHKQWSKPESFDMLVMSSISHLSIKLKDASDKVAYKLKKLQSPNATDAELALVLKDSESPLLKTHNKEIATILRNMRQLEKRLTEINEMIDPREEIQLPQQLTPAAQIRRQYISDYGTSVSSNNAGSSMRGTGSKTQPWSKTSPGDTPRSARSDESEYYL